MMTSYNKSSRRSFFGIIAMLLMASHAMAMQAMNQNSAPKSGVAKQEEGAWQKRIEQLSHEGLPIKGATLTRCYITQHAIEHVLQGELKQKAPASPANLRGLHSETAVLNAQPEPFFWANEKREAISSGVIAMTAHSSPAYKSMFTQSVTPNQIISLLASALKNVTSETHRKNDPQPSVVLEGVTHTGIAMTIVVDAHTYEIQTFFPTNSKPSSISLPSIKAFFTEHYLPQKANACRAPLNLAEAQKLHARCTPISWEKSIALFKDRQFLVPTSALKKALHGSMTSIFIPISTISRAFSVHNTAFPLNREAASIMGELVSILRKAGLSDKPILLKEKKHPGETLTFNLPGFAEHKLSYKINLDKATGEVTLFSSHAAVPADVIRGNSIKNSI